MKFCTNCGAQMVDEAAICTNCGVAFDSKPAPRQNTGSGMTTAAKVLMVLGTIVMALTSYGIALLWCLPMTIVYFKKVKNFEPIGTGFKVCCLLFVSTLGGIFMLLDKNH